MSKVETWIVLSDMQVPYHDPKALDAVEQYMSTLHITGLINIGDFLDMETISSFSQGRARLLNGKHISKDIQEANKILDRHLSIARKNNPSARYIYLEGNHEERIERFLDEHPQFEGLLDLPHLLDFSSRGVEWVRAWSKGEVFNLGKATFTHGLSTSQYHAKKMVEDYGDSIFYGHTHDMMCIPKATKAHPDKVIVGQSIGCLCVRDMPYMNGRPSKWQQGFAVFFVLPDGTYTYYTPRIFNGQFVGPDGKLYVGYTKPEKKEDPLWKSLLKPFTRPQKTPRDEQADNKCKHINSRQKTRLPRLADGRTPIRRYCNDCKKSYRVYE